MIEDAELLRRYAEEHSQDAFAELVRRRVNLVYSVALRQVGGDAHLAEDVTQRVFTDLARKAKPLAQHAVLSGWLYRSAQFAATDVVRAERRRRGREQEAQIMNETSSPAAPADWEKLRPLLDQVLGELDAEDRDALALRYFEERSFAEVGAAIQLTEDAARKRVSRALDKLHGLLASRGVTSTTAALGMALVGQTSVAAPAGLAATVASGALAGAGGVAGWVAILGIMSTSKIAFGVVGIVACVAIGTALFEAKALETSKVALKAAADERAAVEAKLRESETRLAAQSQRTAAAEEDVDKLLKGMKTLQAVPAAVAPPPVPITHDVVQARYKRAQELARSGLAEEALQEFLWCYDEGMPRISSYVGVRNSFLLGEIEKLGPAGLAALQERRSAAEKRMLAGEKDLNATMDFAAINRVLKQDDFTMSVYDQLPTGDSRRKTLASAAYELLISTQRYADAAQARGYASMASLFELTTVERPLPANAPPGLRQGQREYAIESTAKNIEVLAGAGDLANARKLAAKLIEYDGSPETKASIQRHAARAGQPGLLSESAP
jgi:RNA polymerase sigma factor (sigma-70 family)